MTKERKIKILFLAANPFDTDRLQLGEQVRAIFDEIQMSSAPEAFEILPHLAVRASDLQRLLLTHRPSIVHFSGHGSGISQIMLEDAQGGPLLVDKEVLARVLELHQGEIQLVFLNACYTKPVAEEISKTIDYTIGTRTEIVQEGVISFAAAFYRALGFNRTVTFAFKSAKAELDLLRISGSDEPQLFVKDGVDLAKPLVQIVESPSAAHSKPVGVALVNLAGQRATDEEKNTTRQALMSGKLVLEQLEDTAATEQDIVAALQNLPEGDAIHLSVNESLYLRIQEQLFPSPPGVPPALPGLMFVGREDSLIEIKGRLGIESLPQQAATNLLIVRGWPGVGKTTTVGVLARDRDVATMFPDGVLWTALNQDPEVMSKFAEWGRSLGDHGFLQLPTIDDSVARMSTLLRSRRMLIIIDDIWNPAHALPFIRAALDTKCVVLATTRLTSVASALANASATGSQASVYKLPVLTEENALILLSYIAPDVVKNHTDNCRELVRDIECLPLALHVAGRLLKAESEMGLDVGDLIEGIREGSKLLPEAAPLDRAEGKIIPTVDALLRRSTDSLDPETRKCFAYLGVFAPKPATFDMPAMAAVWMVDNPRPMIRKLVGHGLLEPVGSGRFQIHALLVRHANSLLTLPDGFSR
jgi:hypothetical protein